MGYPYDKDWKNKVTKDCVLALDLDQTCFVSAAGAEKRTIEVTHIESGRTKIFKNRTEFWGSTKKVVGGWIKDQNMNMEAKAKADAEAAAKADEETKAKAEAAAKKAGK